MIIKKLILAGLLALGVAGCNPVVTAAPVYVPAYRPAIVVPVYHPAYVPAYRPAIVIHHYSAPVVRTVVRTRYR